MKVGRHGSLHCGSGLVAMPGITQTHTWGLTCYASPVFLPAVESNTG
jgi:hypothetical protein